MGSTGGGNNHQDSFVLRWADFHSNLATCFLDLRSEEDFFDVTLAVDETHQIHAHKVVLSASSVYFKSMLKHNGNGENKHPVLIMPPNVQFCDLTYILDFIYRGEVTVPNEELASLMALAKLLKIKGLVDENETGLSPQATSRSAPERNLLPPGSQKIRRRQPSQIQSPMDFGGQSKKKKMRLEGNKSEEGNNSESETVQTTEEYSAYNATAASGNYTQTQHSEQEQQSMASGSVSGYPNMPAQSAEVGPSPAPPGMGSPGTRFLGLQCPQCPKRLPTIDACREHMKKVHGRGQLRPQEPEDGVESRRFTCEYCDKYFKANKSLISHKKRVHKIGLEEDGSLTERKRGRPKKKPDMVVNEADMIESQGHMYEDQSGKELNRPIGQVQPAPRLQTSKTREVISDPEAGMAIPGSSQRALNPSNDHVRPGSSTSGPRGPQRIQQRSPMLSSGVGRGRSSHSTPSSSGGMDIKRSLGLKLGGQISITSEPSARPSPSGMMKHKPEHHMTRQPPPSQGPSRIQTSDNSALPSGVEVKEEPFDEDEADQFAEEEEEYDEDAFDDFEEEEDGVNNYMYAEENYEEMGDYDDMEEDDGGQYVMPSTSGSQMSQSKRPANK